MWKERSAISLFLKLKVNHTRGDCDIENQSELACPDVDKTVFGAGYETILREM